MIGRPSWQYSLGRLSDAACGRANNSDRAERAAWTYLTGAQLQPPSAREIL
jgi:hypothetical protein